MAWWSSTQASDSGVLRTDSRWGTILTLAGLFAVSLAVRLAAWSWVTQHHVAPVYDEKTYLTRAVAYANILKTYVGGASTPEARARDDERAYAAGEWPPLHPLILGAAFDLFGRSVTSARGIVLLQSTLTTCMLYVLARRLCARRGAALAAGVLHAVYPSFVAYSHLLWSETTYILCLISAVYFAIRAIDSGGSRLSAGFAGAALGLAGLTRAAALPLFVVIPVWLLARTRPLQRGLLLSVVCGATGLAVTSPWLWALWSREGRFFPLATTGGYNLYLENSPWSEQLDLKRAPEAAIEEYAARHRLHRDVAAQQLALEHIRANPAEFALRCYKRLISLWQPDRFLLRQFLCGFYPPEPSATVAAVWACLGVSFFLLIAAAAAGLLAGRGAMRHVDLILLCVVLGSLPHVVSLATTRMSLPFLALLLPAAGAGIVNAFSRQGVRRSALLGVSVLSALILLYAPVRSVVRWLPPKISSYYASFARAFEARVGGLACGTIDRVVFRSVDPESTDTLRIEISTPGYGFDPTNDRTRFWNPQRDGRMMSLLLVANECRAGTPQLRVIRLRDGATASVAPVARQAWRTWSTTELSAVEYIWTGERGPLDEEIADALDDRGGDRSVTAQ